MNRKPTKRYRNINEVPANESNEWAASHCLRCGDSLEEIERRRRAENEAMAEEADPPTLEGYQQLLHAESMEQIREEIADGLQAAAPPYYIINYGRLHRGISDPNHRDLCVCAKCGERILEALFEGLETQRLWSAADLLSPN